MATTTSDDALMPPPALRPSVARCRAGRPRERLGAGETWGGVPARPIGNDERERFKRLVQGIEGGEEPRLLRAAYGPTR
jgi:hypothetical protein